MKKLVSKLMAVIVLFSFITLGSQFTQKASAAGGAPGLTNFYIDTYVDLGSEKPFYHELSENPTLHKSSFPMLVESYQMGYGDVTVYLDGVALGYNECRDYQTEPIKQGDSSVVIGWDKVYKLTPNASRLYNGTHTIEEVCIGTTNGKVMRSSFKFTIQD